MRTTLRRLALLLFPILVATFVLAQPSPRVPVIAGNYVVNVLVEVDGTVKTWGNPYSGSQNPSLGDGIKPSPNSAIKTPQTLAGVSDIVDASVGRTQVLLLKRDGSVLAWGDNVECEVGSRETKSMYSPVPVAGLRGVKQVVASEFISGAVLADGSVWLWGSGKAGQLANGLSGWQTPCAKVPTRIEGVSGVKRLSIDRDSVIALKDDGTVWGWGKNDGGQLCNGTTDKVPQPVQLKGLSQVVDLVVDGSSYFVLADGSVRMCGHGADGILNPDPTAENANHFTPFRVPGIATARTVNSDRETIIVHLGDGTLMGFGSGYHGSLGDGHGDRPLSKPHPPIGVGPVLAHYTSRGASYAIRKDGTVLAWGIPAPPGGKTSFILTPTVVFTVKLAE